MLAVRKKILINYNKHVLNNNIVCVTIMQYKIIKLSSFFPFYR